CLAPTPSAADDTVFPRFRQIGGAGRAALQQEITLLEVDGPGEFDREVLLAVAVGVAVDEGLAGLLLVAKLARRLREVRGPDELEAVVLRRAGDGVDRLEVDLVLLLATEIGDRV